MKRKETDLETSNAYNDSCPEWLSHPITVKNEFVTLEDSSFLSLLSENTLSNLKSSGITGFFPIQNTVLPHLLNYPRVQGDVCVASPTGSGKTLLYVIPVVQSLENRIVPRLRAVIVLPTKELVFQAKDTFQKFVSATNLKLASCCGSVPFANEQNAMIEDGRLKIDILITTPGRLMDHINGTAGFTMEHVKFLVIDEADRLLNQSYQNWIPKVMNLVRHDPVCSDTLYKPPLRVVKLLFSATLTRNPEKLASLMLQSPIVFSFCEDSKYTTPPNLEEHMIVCQIHQKPLVLLHILYTLKEKKVLCFTNTKASTET
jgi:ATP-dependent RNA helicase DDX51/DBP6